MRKSQSKFESHHNQHPKIQDPMKMNLIKYIQDTVDSMVD